MTNRRDSSLLVRLAGCSLFAAVFLIPAASVANAQEGDADRPMVVGIVPGPVAAASIYIKIGDIKGESTDRAHSDWIDVLSIEWGANGTPVRAALAARQMGAQRKRPGRVKYGDITLKKGYDASSPKLALAIANGTRIPKVSLEWTTSEADGSRYVRVELQDVIVSSYRIDAGRDGDRPTESVSLNYAKVETSYIPQDERGNLDSGRKFEGGNIKAKAVER